MDTHTWRYVSLGCTPSNLNLPSTMTTGEPVIPFALAVVTRASTSCCNSFDFTKAIA